MKNADLSLAETQLKFKEFYQKNLQSIYSDLESDRKSGLIFLAVSLSISAMVAIAIWLLISYNVINIYTQAYHIICVFIVLGCVALICWPFYHYNKITKSRVMQRLLSFWGKFKYYREKDIIGKQLIKDAELFSYFNKTVTDDAFWGYYKDTSLSVSEHDLRIHGNRGETRMFKGVMILLNFQKPFRNKTVVLNKGRNWNMLWNNPLLFVVLGIMLCPSLMVYYYYFTEPGVPKNLLLTPLVILFPWLFLWLIYCIYRHFYPKKATDKVVLEGLPFMRHWQVLTDNQVEARYILTPVLMEKMLEIKRMFHGKHIDFSFIDNKLLIAVHTRKNMFETTSLLVPALSYHKVREVVSQLHSIFAVVDVITNSKI